MLNKKITTLCILLFALIPTITSAGQLYAGVAEVNITPEVGFFHFGKDPNEFKPGRPNVDRAVGHYQCFNNGIHDELYAKILVLENGDQTLTIVSLDLLGFLPDRLRTILPDHLKTNILCCSSHNHTAPSTVAFHAPPTFMHRTPYLTKIEENIAKAILQAYDTCVPVKIGVGRGHGHLSYNKLGGGTGQYHSNPQRLHFEPVDTEVGVIRFDDAQGKPLALLVNYASHPVVCFQSLKVSAGYPGYMYRKVEQEIGNGATCFFINGACGDVQPYEACTASFDNAKIVGEKLADTVLNINAHITTKSAPDAVICFTSEILHFPGVMKMEGELLDVEVNTVVINNNIAIASGPGEFFVELQLDLKKRSPLENTFFFGYTNGYLGYFPTKIAVNERWGFGANTNNRLTEVGTGEIIIDKALENITLAITEHQRN